MWEKKLNVTRPEILHGSAVKCVAGNEFGKEEDGADVNVECELDKSLKLDTWRLFHSE